MAKKVFLIITSPIWIIPWLLYKAKILLWVTLISTVSLVSIITYAYLMGDIKLDGGASSSWLNLPIWAWIVIIVLAILLQCVLIILSASRRKDVHIKR